MTVGAEPAIERGQILRIGGVLCCLWLLWTAKLVWIAAFNARNTSAFVLAAALLVLFLLLAFETMARDLPRRYVAHALTAVACGLVAHTYAYVRFSGNGAASDELYLNLAASQAFLAGLNPYGINLIGTFHGYPLGAGQPNPAMFTRFADGTMITTLPYPALAFLVYLPTDWWHVSPAWIDFVGFLAAFVLLVAFAPPHFKTLAPLTLFVHPGALEYLLNYIGDVLYVFPMLVAAYFWTELPIVAGIALGIACAAKQLAWLSVPFFAIGILITTSGRLSAKLQTTAAALAATALTFAIPNAYFAITKPAAWFAGVMSPLVARYEFNGLGLAALNMFGGETVARESLTMAAAVVYLAMLALSIRFFHQLRDALWLAPAAALFFATRSLESYFLYLMPICLASWFGGMPGARMCALGIQERWRTLTFRRSAVSKA